MNTEALAATAWVVSFLILLVANFDPSKYTGIHLLGAWFLIVWIPPIFYKVWTLW